MIVNEGSADEPTGLLLFLYGDIGRIVHLAGFELTMTSQ